MMALASEGSGDARAAATSLLRLIKRLPRTNETPLSPTPSARNGVEGATEDSAVQDAAVNAGGGGGRNGGGGEPVALSEVVSGVQQRVPPHETGEAERDGVESLSEAAGAVAGQVSAEALLDPVGGGAFATANGDEQSGDAAAEGDGIGEECAMLEALSARRTSLEDLPAWPTDGESGVLSDHASKEDEQMLQRV